MQKKKRFGSGVGGSSIILIFIVLSLTTFATLSLVSVNADRKLTKQVADATETFYTADALAERQLAAINETAITAAATAANSNQFKTAFLQSKPFDYQTEENADESVTVSYTIPVGDSQEIQVELNVSYNPETDQKTSVLRKRWQLLSTITEGYGEEDIDLIPIE